MLSCPVICFSIFSASGNTILSCPSYSCARNLSYSEGFWDAKACSRSVLACNLSASLVISSMIFCASKTSVSSLTISSLAFCSSSSFNAFTLTRGISAVSSRSGAISASVMAVFPFSKTGSCASSSEKTSMCSTASGFSST